MQRIYAFELTKDKSFASVWSMKDKPDRLRLTHSHTDWSKEVQPIVRRFDVVRLESTYFKKHGVVTFVKITTNRFRWRKDTTYSVKMFDDILDAIEYSEKKRAKYVDDTNP